jgi:hypothetical protein
MNKLLLILFGVLFVLGCSKKNNPSPQATIVGKWAIQGDTSRQYVAGALNSTYVIVGINSPYYQFNADGTGTLKQNLGPPDLIETFTYTLSNGSITLNFPVQPASPNNAFQLSWEIEKLTANTVIFLWDDTSPGNGSSEYKEDVYLTR